MQRYAITDRTLLPPHKQGWEAALCSQVEQWVEGGVDWVLLREKDLPWERLAALVRSLAAMTRGGATRLLVNGLPAPLALEAGADGVHLAGGASVELVQASVRLVPLVTVSCHSLEEVEAAREGGASAMLWAPVFGKVVGGEVARAGTGLHALHGACVAAGPVPVFALGGIVAANAAACVAAGAAGVAGIRLFHGAEWRALYTSVSAPRNAPR